MPNDQPGRLPAPFFDTAVAGLADAFVSRIHLVIDYDRALDPDRVARAVRLLLDAEPVLGCLYRPRLFRPFWSRLPAERLDAEPVFRFVADEGLDGKDGTAAFLAESLNPRTEPPLKILMLRRGRTDRLLIKADHQVTDAGGLKYLGRQLAHLYNRLEKDPTYGPDPNPAPRGQDQIYQPFLPGRVPALARRYARDLKAVFHPIGNLMFPMGRDRTGDPVFVLRRFGPVRLEPARALAARHGATINDLAAAAMLRALASTANWDGRQTLRLVGTVDMRRYLPAGRGDAVANLSGWYFLNLGMDLGKDLVRTLVKVKKQTSFLKHDYLGLGFNLFGYLILRPIPYLIRTCYMNLNIRMFNRIGNMPPTLTNMGLIDHQSLHFGPAQVTDVFLLVPPAVPPVLALGLSGCRGALTLSAGVFESAVPLDHIENLFDAFDRELPD
jgi:NRPS condensation-like uncharacterized protein